MGELVVKISKAITRVINFCSGRIIECDGKKLDPTYFSCHDYPVSSRSGSMSCFHYSHKWPFRETTIILFYYKSRVNRQLFPNGHTGCNGAKPSVPPTHLPSALTLELATCLRTSAVWTGMVWWQQTNNCFSSIFSWIRSIASSQQTKFVSSGQTKFAVARWVVIVRMTTS
jgi:hypothetical protein